MRSLRRDACSKDATCKHLHQQLKGLRGGQTRGKIRAKMIEKKKEQQVSGVKSSSSRCDDCDVTLDEPAGSSVYSSAHLLTAWS